MRNLFKEFLALIPDPAVQVGAVQSVSANVATVVFDLMVTNPLNAQYKAPLRGIAQNLLNEKSKIMYSTIEYPT